MSVYGLAREAASVIPDLLFIIFVVEVKQKENFFYFLNEGLRQARWLINSECLLLLQSTRFGSQHPHQSVHNHSTFQELDLLELELQAVGRCHE